MVLDGESQQDSTERFVWIEWNLMQMVALNQLSQHLKKGYPPDIFISGTYLTLI
jgi:hypothetical protein